MAQSYRFIDQDSQDFLMDYSDLHSTEVVQKLKKETQQLQSLQQLTNSYNPITNASSMNSLIRGQNMNQYPPTKQSRLQPQQNQAKNTNYGYQDRKQTNGNNNQNYNQEYLSQLMKQQNNEADRNTQKEQDKSLEEGEEVGEKENEIKSMQIKELKKRMIQRNQDYIIDEIYKHQRQLIVKDSLEKELIDQQQQSDQPSKNDSQANLKSNIQQKDQNGYSYSINNGQVLNHQRQQKQDILRMLNPPNYIKQKWNCIQKDIEDRLIPHNEEGLPKNPNPIEKNLLKEKENGYKFLMSDGEAIDGEDSEEEAVSNEVLVTRKIVKILEEFRGVQKRDQDSIFHIALKQYCEKFHKSCDYIYSEEKDLKVQGFLCEVVVDGIRLGPQLGKSKREAKTQACMCAIARIMQSAKDMKPIEYFQKFLEGTRNKYIRLDENIADAITQHHQAGGVPLSPDNPLSDLAIAQEIPENSNYREELSIFAHKNLHKQIYWETLFDPKEKLWLAMVAVGNLSERGFGRSKKYAKNVASYKLLQRCKELRMKDDVFKNPRKAKTQLQFAFNLQESENDTLSKLQDSLIKIRPNQQLIDSINQKRLRSSLGEEITPLNSEEKEQEPEVKKKQKSEIKSAAYIKMKEVVTTLEEKYIDYYKLELSSYLQQQKLPNSLSNVDVFKQLLKYDFEMQATKAQYQSLQNMYNEINKKLLINESTNYLKKLIPIGSYVNNCMNKYSTTMDVVAILTPSQEQGDNLEISRFSDILYSEVQVAILNSNIGYFFKMELNKGCVMLVFAHNSQYKIRLIPNLILEENTLNKRKFLAMNENPLSGQVKQIIDPNENKFYGDTLMHQVWLSQYKGQIGQFESLFRILRRVFKYQGFKVPIDLIDVILAHVSHQFNSSQFQDNLVGFVKFIAQNGIEDIITENLSMVQISQLHIIQLKNCSDFELKKIQEYFLTIYTKKAYDNLIII